MFTIEFGLMLRPSEVGASLGEVHAYNLRCIQELGAGFTLWLEDHLQWGETDGFECFSTLSFLAGQFPELRVGTLVLDQSYRNPALLAKMAANLQFLTGGRFVLGLGAGWKEDEYHAYGYPFPPLQERFERLEEVILVIRALWTTRPATFEGKYHQIREAYCQPRPSPAIPLLLGGGGERRTLALVARYADWWNYNSCPVEEYVRKLAVLKDHCARIGRDPAEIRLTYLSTLSVAEDPAKVVRHPQKHYIAGSVAEVTAEIERFCEIGVTHFMFRIPDVGSLEHFVTAVAPHFA